MMVGSASDLAICLGTESLDRYIARATACEAYSFWDNDEITIGGFSGKSDISQTFLFPVDINKIFQWFDELDSVIEELRR